ncbi:ATP-binding protein [Marinitoga sp. 1197]|uniref:ATP-binding protein n=1 Tax=Marinitoga sp. 1197 TaxID=1428449 RepID=UPI00069A5260|nr:ATP-binding protein [Marinitoga sp. 1197]
MATLRTISDHILDICENAIKSGGDNGYLVIIETKDIFRFCIADNGKGMSEEEIKKALDPFYTTKKQRKKKFGLGLAFLKYSAEITRGYFKIYSKKNKGTTVIAGFNLKHIDCQPIGNITEMLLNLLNRSNGFSWKITRFFLKNGYKIETKYLNENFDITNPRELFVIKKYIMELEKEIREVVK